MIFLSFRNASETSIVTINETLRFTFASSSLFRPNSVEIEIEIEFEFI